MQKKVEPLRALVRSKFDSESAFARQLGWTRQRLNRITTGVREPDLSEVKALSAGLGVPLEFVANFFLADGHHMDD